MKKWYIEIRTATETYITIAEGFIDDLILELKKEIPDYLSIMYKVKA